MACQPLLRLFIVHQDFICIFQNISLNLQHFNASGSMLSRPSAVPSINLFFTIRYSEDVNSVSETFSSFCVIMVSGINFSFSGY